MLPDDLWEILTGQPRPAPQPPRPAPPPEAELEPIGDREERDFEDVGVPARRRAAEGAVLEDLTGHPAPVVVSMETMPLEPRQRHAAFHERIAEPLAVPRKPRVPLMRGRSDLRRAFVLQAVIGTPKGLE
jgi:hypothetical protein